MGITWEILREISEGAVELLIFILIDICLPFVTKINNLRRDNCKNLKVNQLTVNESWKTQVLEIVNQVKCTVQQAIIN